MSPCVILFKVLLYKHFKARKHFEMNGAPEDCHISLDYFVFLIETLFQTRTNVQTNEAAKSLVYLPPLCSHQNINEEFDENIPNSIFPAPRL